MSQTLNANSTQHLMQQAEEWASAEQRGDAALLDRTLVDDFVGIGPLGFMLRKDEWLQRHQSGVLRYTSFSLEDAQVRLYGDAAIMTGRIEQTGMYQGRDTSGQFRTTLVWVRQQSGWRLAGLQLSAIAQPPTGAGR